MCLWYTFFSLFRSEHLIAISIAVLCKEADQRQHLTIWQRLVSEQQKLLSDERPQPRLNRMCTFDSLIYIMTDELCKYKQILYKIMHEKKPRKFMRFKNPFKKISIQIYLYLYSTFHMKKNMLFYELRKTFAMPSGCFLKVYQNKSRDK